MDTPQNQLRAIVLPADPVPIQNPRVQDYAAAETDNVTTSAPTAYDSVTGIPIPSTTNIVTQNGQNMTTQPIGEPVGLDQNAVMPLYNQSAYRVNLSPLSVIANGTTIIAVTCSITHGMSTNDQIAVQGLSVDAANGFYSVTVTSATAFTYEVTSAIPAGSLLQTTTLMVTALVGLPYGYTQIPQTGV